MKYEYNDGGRQDAGFKGIAGDCVARAIAIASGKPYAEVYARLAEGNGTQRITKRTRTKNAGKRTANSGIYTRRKWFRDYMAELGFTWIPTMQIGSGCKVHLDDDLPVGRLVVAVSRHYTAVIDRVIHDTYDPRRPCVEHLPHQDPVLRETRCVYGYWVYQG